MNLQYEVQFNYEGLWWNGDQRKAKIMLHKVRNWMINVTNPLLEEFNSKWNKLHPEIKGMEEGSSEWSEYNKFIADKCNEKTLAIRMISSDVLGLDIRFDPDMDAEIVVSNSYGGKAYITLKPVEHI